MRLIIVLLSIEGEEGDNGDELAMGRPAAAALLPLLTRAETRAPLPPPPAGPPLFNNVDDHN